MRKEGDAGTRSDEEELNMREKDEGDLFGIRAIEAGFFGGVAQSRPTSLANSPVATPRGGSPAPSNRNSMVNTKNIALGQRGPTLSTSTINLSQYVQRQSSPENELAPPRSGTPSSLRQVSNFAEAGAAKNSARKAPPSPVRMPGNTNANSRLQPSDAELNGRINHNGAVNMALEVPPSPLRLSPTHPRDFHEPASPRMPPHEITHPNPYEQHLEPEHDDENRLSTSSSRYSWRNSVVEHYRTTPVEELLSPSDPTRTKHLPDDDYFGTYVGASNVGNTNKC